MSRVWSIISDVLYLIKKHLLRKAETDPYKLLLLIGGEPRHLLFIRLHFLLVVLEISYYEPANSKNILMEDYEDAKLTTMY